MVLISQDRCVISLSVRSSGGDIQMGMMLHGGNMSSFLTIKNFRTAITTNVVEVNLWPWIENKRVIKLQERLNGYRLSWKPHKQHPD